MMLIWIPLITIIQGQAAEKCDRLREELRTKDAEISRLREELSEVAKVCTINKLHVEFLELCSLSVCTHGQ